ncbi:carbohydrate ABC transporter permease [Vallitalea guaymasensis]|uniref:Carbohydrate ABC transporter permease n=1 Tax=Vallitalea guaymasensis TaxID=1185412 RepID=A0A8J8MEB3_9FIRM|nr:carbohydrate ABC transporter permease [Vallitalea guaymasensis]QUH31341.1 carbohydrate ABC transporter permease [Vallitalea guaymasensis]
MIQSKNGQVVQKIITHAVLIIISATCLLPFILLISVSLSSEQDILNYGYRLIPHKIDFTAYKYVFENSKELIRSYEVSIFITVVATVISVFLKLLAAYPLSQKAFKCRKVIMFFIFFTMLFNGGLVPSYILISQYLNLDNTIWVMIIPQLVSAWDIIIMRTFLQRIPVSLFEAAKIDGANQYKIFIRIVIPLSKPIIATIALFTCLAKWNDWFTALLYIRDSQLYPLQYLLQRILMDLQFLIDHAQNAPAGMADSLKIPGESMRMAMCILAAGPMVFIFPFFQKYFVKGITIGSVKG